MKKMRIFAMMLVALSMIVPITSFAQEHGRPHRAEISVVNDTSTQVSFYITSEKCGRWGWSYKPGYEGFLNCGPDKKRARVGRDDQIEIADWGKTNIQSVAAFRDGAWYLSIRDARRELRQK
jgi:hypothetical protein